MSVKERPMKFADMHYFVGDMHDPGSRIVDVIAVEGGCGGVCIHGLELPGMKEVLQDAAVPSRLSHSDCPPSR